MTSRLFILRDDLVQAEAATANGLIRYLLSLEDASLAETRIMAVRIGSAVMSFSGFDVLNAWVWKKNSASDERTEER